MAHTDLIDSLIDTYRKLNLMIRPMANEQAGAGGQSLLGILSDLRLRELQVSQQLKNMTMADGRASAELAVPEPFDPSNPRILLSEFGTAREAILALVRNMPEDQLDLEREGPDGMTTIRKVVEGLVQRDQQVLKDISALVPAARA